MWDNFQFVCIVFAWWQPCFFSFSCDLSNMCEVEARGGGNKLGLFVTLARKLNEDQIRSDLASWILIHFVASSKETLIGTKSREFYCFSREFYDKPPPATRRNSARLYGRGVLLWCGERFFTGIKVITPRQTPVSFWPWLRPNSPDFAYIS